ncbi:hypothetical protein [Nocardia higoensis]|uniref:hypothetical protein n=1 Tax=Nocardia higoensis TaxID=228599 RepID=UPI0002DFD695|nr:hypothetical protein [Nocardia higoensis]
MSMPNPSDHDDDTGEELLGGRQTAREAEILAALSADLEGSEVEKLAAQLLVPVVPDGGSIGRTVAPHVDRLTKARDWTRIWGPALATTGAAGVAVAVLPLPGPLALYVLALAAFAWWHCAGRPGAVETVRMLGHAIGDAGSWIRRHIESLARWRARYETLRTKTTPAPETD